MRSAVFVYVLLVSVALSSGASVVAQSDLDVLMRRVLERRDESWKRLQQYILDEREAIDITGPDGSRLWGERRDYTWYIRDGFFVRSPLRVNGVAIAEPDRLAYEERFLRREKRQEDREREKAGAAAPEIASDLGGIIQQTRDPGFISSARFLEFKFDSGQYAFVGREDLAGREVLKIEYYPTRLFEPDPDRVDDGRRRDDRDRPYDIEMRRLLNKGSLVTLWVDPAQNQILKYTFDNAALDIFPGSWLVRAESGRASMTMAEAFPGVWLPRDLAIDVTFALAVGRYELRYSLEYHDYRQPDVTSVIRIPEQKR